MFTEERSSQAIFATHAAKSPDEIKMTKSRPHYWHGFLAILITISITMLFGTPCNAQTVPVTVRAGAASSTPGSGSASYQATVTLGNPVLNSEQTVDGDPTYKWSAGTDTCEPATGGATTIVEAARSTAGTYSSTVTCLVTLNILDTKTNQITTETGTNSATVSFSLGVRWNPDTTAVQMTKPQNQTQTPYTPQYVVVQAGASVACAAAGTAVDDWNFGASTGTATNTNFSYSWTASAGSFDSPSSASPNWTAPAVGQSGPMTLTCTATAIPPAIVPPDGGTRGSGSATCTVQVYVPTAMTITGQTNMNYYIDGSAPSVTFSTATNNSLPTPITYSWSVTGPLIINGSTTGSSVSVSTTNPGTSPSGTVNLSYTPAGGSAMSATPFVVFVHTPTTIQISGTETPPNVLTPTAQAPGQGFGFDDEAVTWQLLDQMGNPMSGETVSENWPGPPSQVLDSTIGQTLPLTGAQTTLAPSAAYPLTYNSSWTTDGSGIFDSADGFGTSGWGFAANGTTLVWAGSHALFTAVHQFLDHGNFTSHNVSWASDGASY